MVQKIAPYRLLNDNRAANVQRLGAIVSVRVQAQPATSILSNARKSVESGSAFSLSFRSFLSLFIAIKEKEKDISKNFFLFQNSSYFFFFIAIKEEKVSKKKKLRTIFYNLTVVVQMDIAGRACSFTLAKNARGTNVVQF